MVLPLPAPQKPQPSADGGVEIEEFRRFDVVSDFSDHFYAGVNKFAPASKDVPKKIMQEWKILEEHLPDSIFVRGYENRIDLLRAAIIGAAGTPYHDGLFFFDIAFPSDYPTRPPFVYYRSFGLRINPNLYANGRVCLSLLNTWAGMSSERWVPTKSTLLQVLLSIQALVLNEKPYFNEPGTTILPGRSYWEQRSNSYNAGVFALSCSTMLYTLRKPPKNFEDFVAAHFRERARTILSACNAYVHGQARVAFYRDDGSSSSSGEITDASRKLKRSMARVYPAMVKAFAGNGASLGNFVEQLEAEAKEAEAKKAASEAEKIRKRKRFGGVWEKLKKALGFKKRTVKDKENTPLSTGEAAMSGP